MEKINEMKSWFWKRSMSYTDEDKEGKTQITKMRNE